MAVLFWFLTLAKTVSSLSISQGKFARIKKSGDLPDSYGFLLMPPSLYDNRTAMAIGGKGYHFYNSKGLNTRKIPMTKGGAKWLPCI